MFGCYRKDEVADSDYFMTAAVGVLMQFSEETIIRVTDPIAGLPSKLKWMPTIQEIRAECERVQGEYDRAVERVERRARQIDENEQWLEQQKKPRPTLDELKQRYGKNWGLESLQDLEEKIRAEKEEHLKLLERASKNVFEKECVQAGFPKNSQISPTLTRLIIDESSKET